MKSVCLPFQNAKEIATATGHPRSCFLKGRKNGVQARSRCRTSQSVEASEEGRARTIGSSQGCKETSAMRQLRGVYLLPPSEGQRVSESKIRVTLTLTSSIAFFGVLFGCNMCYESYHSSYGKMIDLPYTLSAPY